MQLNPTELEQVAGDVARAVDAAAVLDSVVQNGEVTLVVDKRRIVALVKALREDSRTRFTLLSDVTAIDYLELGRLPRFDVVYHLSSIEHGHRLRLRAPVEEADCRIDSITGLWSGASFMEREVYDLMGVVFDGHPDLRRILLADDWEGHPLRKDFPLGGAKSFYYKQDTNEYAGEPSDLVPRIRVQDGDV